MLDLKTSKKDLDKSPVIIRSHARTDQISHSSLFHLLVQHEVTMKIS